MSEDSSVTSIEDDNTENFIDNPTRELLAEGFMGFFSPIIENLDSKVKQTQLVQLNINAQLDILSAVIRDQINRQSQQDFSELDNALRQLTVIKSKVTVLTNVLQSAQDRLQSMNQKVEASELAKQSIAQAEQ